MEARGQGPVSSSLALHLIFSDEVSHRAGIRLLPSPSIHPSNAGIMDAHHQTWLYMGSEDPNPAPLAYLVGTLPIESFGCQPSLPACLKVSPSKL